MTPTPVVCVHGTWGADFEDGDEPNYWYERGSAFCEYLKTQGFDPECFEELRWSGNLEGLSGFWPWNWFKSPERRTWQAGAYAMKYLLVGAPVESRNLICHSHAGQLALILAAKGFQINTLVTVGTPVRGDVPAEKARPNIGRWLHLYSEMDRVQVRGSLGDRRWGAARIFPLADANSPMPGGHSDVLYDPTLFSLWKKRGWLEFIQHGQTAGPRLDVTTD